MADESVEEVELRVRDIVTSPRRSSHLRKDSEAWHSLVASLDAIGDTQLAIRYYLRQPERDRSDFGRSYLTVYGSTPDSR